MAIDFSLTPEQRQLQLSARRFAADVLSGVGPAMQHLATPRERFQATRPMYEALVREGFMRRLVPQPFGGAGTGMIDMAIVTEEFYAVDVNVSLTMLANLLGLTPIFMAGSPAQQQQFISPFLQAHGAPLAALANSEPGGSANFAAPSPGEGTRTVARLEGDEWVIDGAKQWVSSATGWEGDGADVLSVVCRTDAPDAPHGSISIIAVPKGSQGIVTVRDLDALGHRGHLTPHFRLQGVRVPRDNLIGPVGGGQQIVEGSFTGTAALVGIMGVALMRAAFDFALNFAKTERRGGVLPIIEHQAVGYALADAKTKLEAARYLGWRACHAMDQMAPGGPELALQSKIFGSEAAVSVITRLMQVVGVDSYSHDLPLAGLLQDAIALPLFDGGNMGVRRRQLHGILKDDQYNSLTAAGTA
ncbi:acyl-CoA dehydrogenase family protein [Variovorax sp. J31P207]|uniref:acyl-CoA dehydrogenase family protein n=1 Tax=Variovorax sp. J31P207 TaxID=3053510 RepID=UPI002574AE89|nr:acyl-CoA dehydrogenase family protein [Variovorax sp. J31P207]MDM0071440.1 acyl-CoA dehydrogenase family protein [Variovorax sp. J31P207]